MKFNTFILSALLLVALYHETNGGKMKKKKPSQNNYNNNPDKQNIHILTSYDKSKKTQKKTASKSISQSTGNKKDIETSVNKPPKPDKSTSKIPQETGGKVNENKTPDKTDKKTGKPSKERRTNKAKIWRKLSNINSHEDFFKVFDIQQKMKFQKVKVSKKKPTTPKTPPSGTSQDEYGYIFSADVDPNIRHDATGPIAPTVFRDYECDLQPQIFQIPVVSDGAYWPGCLKLDQCGGCCSPSHICVPTQLENRTTTIFKIPYDGGAPFLQNVYMIHHKRCGCKCRIQATDCQPKQTYSTTDCSCTCTRTKEDCPVRKQWSDSMCDCVCSKTDICPERHYWNKERCNCECLTKKCPVNHIRDPSTCYCISTI